MDITWNCSQSTYLNGCGHYLELFTDLSVADAKLVALPLEVLVELGGADAGVPEDDAVDESRVHTGVLLLSQTINCTSCLGHGSLTAQAAFVQSLA